MQVLIYGSCVSRDAMELSPQPGVELAGYFARSSIISAFGRRKTDLGTAPALVRSSFQRRMLEADASKSLVENLRTQQFDLLLLDIIDERFHVLVRGEERITDSSAFRESQFLTAKPGSWRKIASGSDEHFAEWTIAVDKLLKLVAELPRRVEVAFIDADWASTIAGPELDSKLVHAGMKPSEANELYERYREFLRSKLSEANLIRPPAAVTISDPQQKWGLAPFHYVQEFYDFVGRRLSELAATSSR
ncbi:DUF6270 domain-containing protein [Pseudarthrobacter sp. J1763]|uniref:DUF6270 domain-containing protein n=1 Tax=Pseudarthrobacter sp. J1763 TaxID=3420445 RepID=UPI003D2AAEA6